MIRHPLAFVAAITMAVGSFPAVAADIDAGRKIADAWCASCHLTSATGTDTAPQFSEIARNRSLSSNSLSRTLAAPHPQCRGWICPAGRSTTLSPISAA